MRTMTLILLFSFCVACWKIPAAVAIPAFQKVFIKQYADKKKNPEYYKTIKEAKCWTCHQYDPKEPKKKKKHNAYGEALEKLLDKKKDKKNVEKIVEALTTVAAEHSDLKDEKSPTYGELIKQGKLPSGKYTGPPKKEDGETGDEGKEDKKTP